MLRCDDYAFFTEALQQLFTIQSFRERLLAPPETLPWPKVNIKVEGVLARLRELGGSDQLTLPQTDEVSVDLLYDLEKHLIFGRAKSDTASAVYFAELEPPEPSDNKTEEAARLFLSKRYDLPYYFGFDALSVAAHRNVEQFSTSPLTMRRK